MHRPIPRAAIARAVLWAGLVSAGLAGSCSAKRWPRPMEPEQVPLPQGVALATTPGLEEVAVFRHADPVFLRRAGTDGAFPLTFYSKKDRVRSGSWVATGPGGRAELVWSSDTSHVFLYGECVAGVGEPSRDEPTLRLPKLDRVRLRVTPEDRYELPGGAMLLGNPDEDVWPILVEQHREEVVRVANHGKLAVRVHYRDAELTIGPGQVADLALLEAGSSPEVPIGELSVFPGPGFGIQGRGAVSAVPDGRGVLIEAEDLATVEGLGVRLNLEAGDRALFTSLRDPARPAPTPAPVEPTPAPVEPAPVPETGSAPAGDPQGTDPSAETTPGTPGVPPVPNPTDNPTGTPPEGSTPP